MNEQETSGIAYREYGEEHVDGALELHAALFPVRYTRALLQSFVAKPDTTALVAVTPAGRVVGFISCRVQTPRSIVETLLGKQQPCLPHSSPFPIPSLFFMCSHLFSLRNTTTDIMTFGVLPECQRQGIATALLAALRTRLQTRYAARVPLASRVLLHVQASNTAALAFYRHAGFRIEEFLPEYYHFDSHVPDDLRTRFDWSSAAYLLSAPLDPAAPEHSSLAQCWACISGLFSPMLSSSGFVVPEEKNG